MGNLFDTRKIASIQFIKQHLFYTIMRNTQNSGLIYAGVGLVIFILIRVFRENEAAREMAIVFVPF